MHAFPSLSIPSILLGAFLSFVWGGLYWGLISSRVAQAVRLDANTQKMPPVALVLAFGTRIVITFGIAAITAFAGVSSPAAGALSGAAIFAVTVLPMMVGQASFGPPFGSWPRLAVALPEALVSFAIMGAAGVLWR
jgi:hypothetical protein